MATSKSSQPPSILLQGLIVIRNQICAGGAGVRGAFALGKDQHTHSLAQTMRQNHYITHLLVGLTRVKRHAHVDFHSCIELGVRGFFRQCNRIVRTIDLVQIHFGQSGQCISFRV